MLTKYQTRKNVEIKTYIGDRFDKRILRTSYQIQQSYIYIYLLVCTAHLAVIAIYH